MGAHRLPCVHLSISKPAGELRSLGEELNLFDTPLIAMRVVLALTDHAAIGIALAIYESDGFSANALCTHHIADLRLRYCCRESALQILSPEHALAAAREQPHVVREILIGAELIVRTAMLFQTADDELRSTAREVSRVRSLLSSRHSS